jgi:Icc-related predicted phosphoesterase
VEITCISDLHGYYPKLDRGDLLIVAGDLTGRDTHDQHVEFSSWLKKQHYRMKIVIAGNHDGYMEKNVSSGVTTEIGPMECTYLCDSGTEFEGLKIWGSPWSLWFPGINPKCSAFTGNENKLMDAYDKIPSDTDILITHGPAYSILDETRDDRHVGSKGLYGWLKYVGRPRLHVFGHIHESYGQKEVFPTHNDKMMLSVNCSIVNENYEHVNEPIRVIL